MKTIFVPTDFSPAADHAANYAYFLAKNISARLILYHTYHIPVSTAEVPTFVVSPAELEKASLQQLEERRDTWLRDDESPVSVECVTSPGFAVDEIREISEEKNADLVIMGVSGAGKIKHAILGSVVTGVMNHIRKPMIVVPEKATIRMPERMGLACDYHLAPGGTAIDQVKEFVRLFGSELFVINVERPDEVIGLEKTASTLRLEGELSGVIHSLHFPVNEKVTEGLIEFEDNHAVDLLVMVPHPHTFFERVFQSSHTRQMIFHTHKPLLIIKDHLEEVRA